MKDSTCIKLGKPDVLWMAKKYGLSIFEAHAGLFRWSVKGIFDAYVMWPFEKELIYEF